MEKTLNILLIEDDQVDVMNVKRAFERNRIANPLYVAGDGIEGLEMLRNGKVPSDRRIVLLDLNMPRMNGIEFLRELRADPRLLSTPVVVLTTSNDDRDKIDAYNLNVAGYLLKPVTFINFVEVTAALNKYWTLVELPLIRSDMAETLRVLIVDDDRVDRMAVKRLLVQSAFRIEVSECDDQRSASEAVRETPFDCVLLDYHLPGSDGLAVLRELRNGGNPVPVVALTGQGDEEVAVELMKAGAADYLNKNTLTAERLERSLRYALALHRAEEERRQLLEREQQARLQAQAANRAKDEFLATLSHELRTPLNAILGWSRLMASGHLDESTTRRAIEIIERNTRLQAQLIEDLLDISRIITGKLRLEFRAVNVRSILEAAVDSVRPAADAKRIRLECDIDGAHAIMCDPARMQQVVWNLLSNAIKFTPEQGRVTLKALRSNGTVVIEVNDTGAGIDPAFLPFVFDRFRQQDAATTRAHGGLGLGLSIVRHLVELHGGTVEARSEGVGHGATFAIAVPVAPLRVAEASAAEQTADESFDELPSLAGVRVLVVDNEPDARALVAAILEGCGAQVRAAASVAEAMAEIQRERPDVLLSDIAMPGEDGYALIRKVRAIDRAMPAAALTAFATAGDRARTLLAGYQAHLPKPIEPSELTAVVATLAGRTVVRS